MKKKASGLLSRSGESSPLGKRTFELPKTKVPEETAEILMQRAKAVGMSLSEYLCWQSMIAAHGLEHVESLMRQRLAVVAGKREKSAA